MRVILVVTQAGSDCERGDCNGAKERGCCSSLSEVVGIVVLKAEQRTAQEAFCSGKEAFANFQVAFSRLAAGQ